MCEIDHPRFFLFACLFVSLFYGTNFGAFLTNFFFSCSSFFFSCLLFSQGAGVHFHTVVPRPLADCFFVVL